MLLKYLNSLLEHDNKTKKMFLPCASSTSLFTKIFSPSFLSCESPPPSRHLFLSCLDLLNFAFTSAFETATKSHLNLTAHLFPVIILLHDHKISPTNLALITTFFSDLTKQHSSILWTKHITEEFKSRLLLLLFSISKRPSGCLSETDPIYDDTQKSVITLITHIVKTNSSAEISKSLTKAFLPCNISQTCKNSSNNTEQTALPTHFDAHFGDPTVDECGERMSSSTTPTTENRILIITETLSLLDMVFLPRNESHSLIIPYPLYVSVLDMLTHVTSFISHTTTTVFQSTPDIDLLKYAGADHLTSSLCACNDVMCETKTYLSLLYKIFSNTFSLLLRYLSDKALSPDTLMKLNSSLHGFLARTNEHDSFVRFFLKNVINSTTKSSLSKILLLIKSNMQLSPSQKSTSLQQTLATFTAINGNNNHKTSSSLPTEIINSIRICIFHVEPILTFKTVDSIFALMGGEPFLDADTITVVKNEEAVTLLFSLFSRGDQDIQNHILATLNGLLGGQRRNAQPLPSSTSTVNKSVCSQMSPPLLDQLLHTFPLATPAIQHQIVEIMQQLGRHYINVSQAKKIFNLMRGTKNNCRSEVRVCEERSDELKRREYWISMYMPDTSKCNVAATKFFAISNATNGVSTGYQCTCLDISKCNVAATKFSPFLTPPTPLPLQLASLVAET